MRLKQRLISKEGKILRRFVILAIAVTGLLAFGATTSFDVMTDVVCIDITGCAHLHADELDEDEGLHLGRP